VVGPVSGRAAFGDGWSCSGACNEAGGGCRGVCGFGQPRERHGTTSWVPPAVCHGRQWSSLGMPMEWKRRLPHVFRRALVASVGEGDIHGGQNAKRLGDYGQGSRESLASTGSGRAASSV
jgi:hypothetical protein